MEYLLLAAHACVTIHPISLCSRSELRLQCPEQPPCMEAPHANGSPQCIAYIHQLSVTAYRMWGVTSFLNWLWVIFTPAKFAVSPGGGPGHAEAEHSYFPDRNPIKDLCHCSHCWQVVSRCPGDYWCPNPGLVGLLPLSLQEHPCSGEYIQAHGGQTHYCYQRFLRSSSCEMFGLKLYNPWCQKMITR